MKKLIALILAAATVLCFAACKSKKDNNKNQKTDKPGSSSSVRSDGESITISSDGESSKGEDKSSSKKGESESQKTESGTSTQKEDKNDGSDSSSKTTSEFETPIIEIP